LRSEGRRIAQIIGVYRDPSYNCRHFSANPKGGMARPDILSDFSGQRPDKSDARNRIAMAPSNQGGLAVYPGLPRFL